MNQSRLFKRIENLERANYQLAQRLGVDIANHSVSTGNGILGELNHLEQDVKELKIILDKKEARLATKIENNSIDRIIGQVARILKDVIFIGGMIYLVVNSNNFINF